MRGAQVIRCLCCGLDQLAPDRPADPSPMRCARCHAHRGHAVERMLVREHEHVVMYARALLDTQDDVFLAGAERDLYRDRMQDAYTSVELLLGVLLVVDDQHRPWPDGGCSCGDDECAILRSVADPRVRRLIRYYEQERDVLLQLRDSNADSWIDHWHHIDVLVDNPDQPPPYAYGGRHRAVD